MIRTIAVNDTVGFRTFGGAIQYGLVVEIDLRGAAGRPSRRDEIYILLRHNGRRVLVQRWRIVERYSGKLTKSKSASNNAI
ncbi:MAG TPA: hypothetical protein VFC63_00350 [Blastocatellia bacterium]|nr:hypothetical protein [Blastocatellia bacterium]